MVNRRRVIGPDAGRQSAAPITGSSAPRGIAGPCSTIQLANFRRGLQDHQYLTLARKAGLDSLVRESLEEVVPKMFSDAGETVGFLEHGDDYERARYRLGKALEKSGVTLSRAQEPNPGK
jgi:hypothetical protein